MARIYWQLSGLVWAAKLSSGPRGLAASRACARWIVESTRTPRSRLPSQTQINVATCRVLDPGRLIRVAAGHAGTRRPASSLSLEACHFRSCIVSARHHLQVDPRPAGASHPLKPGAEPGRRAAWPGPWPPGPAQTTQIEA